MTEAMPIQQTDGSEHEVVVVGARCAGAATAMLLARQGHDVVLIDRATFPSDTISTHAIARGGMVQLARWGLLGTVLRTGAPKIHSATFHLGAGRTLKRAIKDRAGVDHLLAPRRYLLDTILASAAVDAGASFQSGVSVTDTVTDAQGRVVGVTVRDEHRRSREVGARMVVGADGVRSCIARAVRARVIDERPSGGAAHYAYVAGLDADGFEFHVGEDGFAGVFPTNGGEANVWICSPASAARLGTEDRAGAFLDLLSRTSPMLADRVRRAELTSGIRGAVRLPNHVREAAGRGWALVGDAGYHRDPITGHGITDAFRDAELLAHHLGRALRGEVSERDAMAAYADERDRAPAPIFDVTCRLAGFPAPDEFTELQKQLSELIEAEATWLAGRPPLPAADLVAA